MSIKILLVDDERKILNSIGLVLESEGYRVYKASNGQEAVFLAKTHKFSLIILDVMMPEMSGFETCQWLRKEHDPEDVPIMMLTAVGGRSDVLKAVACGAQDYCLKPIDLDVLLKKVEKFTGFSKVEKKEEKSQSALNKKDFESLAHNFSVPASRKIISLFLNQKESHNRERLREIISLDPIFTFEFLKESCKSENFDVLNSQPLEHSLSQEGIQRAERVAAQLPQADDGETALGEIDLHDFWIHSIVCGLLSQNIISTLYKKKNEIGYLGGLLQGIGQLALAQGFKVSYSQVFENIHKVKSSAVNAEKMIFSYDHFVVTHHILKKWKIPVTVQKAALPPHYLKALFHSFTDHDLMFSTASYVAYLVSKTLPLGHSGDRLIENVPRAYFTRLRLDRNSFNRILDTTLKELIEICVSSNIDIDSFRKHQEKKEVENRSLLFFDPDPEVPNLYFSLFLLSGFRVIAVDKAEALSRYLYSSPNQPLIFDARRKPESLKVLGSLDVYPFLKDRPLVVLSAEKFVPSDTGNRRGAWISNPVTFDDVLKTLFEEAPAN